jgi:radical SAM superfamily enzyme YgiQ (UPF0313 family)
MSASRSILLVHPSIHARSTLRSERFVHFQPLGLACIAAATPPHWTTSLIDESFEDVEDFSGHSIIGISTNTRTALHAYELARRAKECGCYTVAGGIHASMCTQEALLYFDTVISGEGEILWRDFLRDFERAAPRRVYESTSFEEMDALPFPDRGAMRAPYSVGSIQTSRGCPFNCSFCSVTAFNGKRYRQRHPEGVLRELESIPQRYVFFVDDNLIGCSRASRDRAYAIFNGMIRRRMHKRYIAQVTIDFGLDDRLLSAAHESGCAGVFIGVESVDTSVLASMNKSVNLSIGVDRFAPVFKNVQRHGIAVIATLTVGNDDEPEGIFDMIKEFVERSGVDAVQLTVTTPLPGTRLFDDLMRERRIVFDDFPADWVHYSLGSLVFEPKRKSAREMSAGWKDLVDSVYSYPRMLKRAARTLRWTKSVSSATLAFTLNKAYRRGYRNSLFYNAPALDRFHQVSHH